MGLYDFTIYSIIIRNAQLYGNDIGWIAGDEKISHGQFKETVDKLACGLVNIGLKKGDRIGVLSQNNMEFMYLYGAAAKTGCIMLPINWRLQPEEVEYIISDGAPKFLFAEKEFQDQTSPLRDKFDFIKKTYSMGSASGYLDAFEDLLKNDGVCPEIDVHSEDDYLIIHTAAVAGKPRGATLSHRGIIASNIQSMYIWNITKEDCHLCMLPLFHIAGLGTALNVMHAGGKNVMLAKFDADLALKHISEDRVSIFVEFPPMLSTLLERNNELNVDLTSLRVVGGLDAPDTIQSYEEITGGKFWTGFGQSETSGFVTFAPYFEKVGSAGIPAFMAEVQLVDGEGNFVETGEQGEIVVRGPVVFNGYWNLDEDNAYTFRDGWHHTGDMGKFDEEGYLFYTGRKPEKELIKPGGENVYPAEVEKTILEHPLVEEVSVIGVPDSKWGEAIKAKKKKKKGESL
ncbi:MAG: AMP-binding protein, partial [Deltaproteobacteria bacterium]|nr:AMP-binding protein [Deltaproteobacteria bacterium]